MKHVKSMSKPAKAEETAPVSLKEVFGFNLGFVDLSRPLTQSQSFWVLDEINDALTK